MTRLIAIAGGIGAGKSVVSRILRAMGYSVYDTDTEAKRIMDLSTGLKAELVLQFGKDVVVNGHIDRKRLGEIVFSDKSKLLKLNQLVHGAVIADLLDWRAATDVCAAGRSTDCGPMIFVETAILYESGLDAYVDEVWEVTAPADIRIKRIVKRSSGKLTVEDAKARIKAQTPEQSRTLHSKTHFIINDDITPVLPQVSNLLTSGN